MSRTIAVIGAGPKAAALAARAAVLRDLSVDPTREARLEIFEQDEVGAAWSGGGNFSSGYLELCTPPERDVGFPYDEADRQPGFKKPIAPELFSRFSWQAFCVATSRYSEWIDRGRQYPTHRRWAEYLAWVFDQAKQPVRTAKVKAVRPTSRKRWVVEFSEAGSERRLTVDGVVITGTGRARRVPTNPDVPADRHFDTETFWPNRDALKVRTDGDGAIAIAGDGGGAGAIIAWLAERYAEEEIGLVSINPTGTLFPRGDGYAERRWFSDPSEWAELSEPDRRKLIDRTEAGVISARNKDRIDRCAFLDYRRGRADDVRWDHDELQIGISYDGETAGPVKADYLISAIGFDSWSLLDVVDDPAVAALLAPSGAATRETIERTINWDLALPPVSGLPAGLHVPALAGFAQGPGMGNLGCLGLVADAILRAHRN